MMNLISEGKHLCFLARLTGVTVRNLAGRTESRVGETSVFVQNGHKIFELPQVVKKVNDVNELNRWMGLKNKDKRLGDIKGMKLPATSKKMSDEENELISGFSRCYNSSSIFLLLQTIPLTEVTPHVAAHALRKVFELENNFEVRNPGFRATLRGSLKHHTFQRQVFLSFLLDVICSCKDPAVVLDSMSSVMQDRFPGDQELYKARLLEEVLVCVMDGVFSLQEICKTIHILSSYYSDQKKCVKVADLFWVGILDNCTNMTAMDIVSVVTILPHLRKSRKIILNLLEKKVVNHCHDYSSKDVVTMLKVLQDLKYDRVSRDLLGMLSSWLIVNMHIVTQKEIINIVSSFHQLEYMDTNIVTAIEKIIKHTECHLLESDLISAICSYCVTMRIRSPTILEGVGKYFIDHHKTFTVPQVSAIVGIFGQINFQPPNSLLFWDLVEQTLILKFAQFSPTEIINLLVSFLYIEKFPVNLINKLFSPFFLDRLHSQTPDLVTHSRDQLKLVDITMNMECRVYEGPFLPRNMNCRSGNKDSRIARTVTVLMDTLTDMLSDKSRLSKNVVLSSFSQHPLYTVDIMIYPEQSASPVAVLVLTPEQYDSSGVFMLGRQAMRVRHLRSMGYKVMCVNMCKTDLMVKSDQLREYLTNLYTEACNTK